MRACRAQFMTGDALLVSPILHWNVAQAPAYFPPGRWYSLYDYAPVDAGTYGLNSTVHVRTSAILLALPMIRHMCLFCATKRVLGSECRKP